MLVSRLFFQSWPSANVPQSCIRTYGKRGVAGKSALFQNDHVMLQPTSEVLTKLPEETHMTRDPLRVRTRPGLGIAESWTRLDLRIVYPIEYRQRVCEIGDVVDADVPKLLQYRKELHDQGKAGRIARKKGIVVRDASKLLRYRKELHDRGEEGRIAREQGHCGQRF